MERMIFANVFNGEAWACVTENLILPSVLMLVASVSLNFKYCYPEYSLCKNIRETKSNLIFDSVDFYSERVITI